MTDQMTGTSEATAKEASPIDRLLRPVRFRLFAAMAMAGLGAALTLVPLAGIAHIARIALGEADVRIAQAGIWWAVWVSLASLFAGLALIAAAELVAHLADNRLTHRLRLAIMQRLGRVPLGWFSQRSSGEVKQAMQDDIGILHELTAHYYTTLGRTVGAIAISVVYMVVVDWRMAIVSLLPFPFFYLIFGAAKKAISQERMRAFVDGQANINAAIVEFVNGIPVVKTFGAGGKAHRAYGEAVDAFLKAFLGFTAPLVAPLANANAIIAPVSVLGVVLAFGTLFVHLGWIAPVDILPFALVAPGISAPLMLLNFIGHGVTNGTAAALRVEALLDTPPLEQPSPDRAQLPADAEIRFENVGYAYDGENRVLSGIDLTLEPGTVTAIVGASGSGKSTLARLILRFFDPTEGRILLGGVDLKRIETAQLYRRIGFVLQDVRLIHASIGENIALGRPAASQREIEAAAHAANIHERILALPRGYESVVGEDAQLSGGEQQRVSIARAVLLDPPVLVLDEPTASADAENEAAIQDALSRLAGARTLLVIAHRLDTVMHADRIVVIDGGRIGEQGSHDELLALNGRYARLWRAGGHDDLRMRATRP